MNGGLTSYIVLGIIISVIVNILFMKVKKIYDIWLDKRRRENEPLPDTRHYYVPATVPTRVSPPPTPNNNHRYVSQEPVQYSRSETISVGSRPPIPQRRTRMRTPDTFPKCPRCGCKNYKGNMNLIIWDNGANRWRCRNGHLFNS